MRVAARTAAAVAVIAGALAIAACGTPSPDLFVVTRTGTLPGAKLTLLVSDTSARCNRAPAKTISNAQTIEARDILMKLQALQQSNAPPSAGRAQFFSFAVRDEFGTVRFPDVTVTPVFARIARLTRDLAIGVCHLPR